MKKNIKILTLALSLLLIIGAVIGVTAFAADAPSVEIVRKNISYDGAVKTLYAIDAENIGTGKVAVQFYSVDPSTEGATADYTKFASEKITLDDAEYDVVFSTGFRPTDLRKSIFAVPVIVDGDKVVAKGAAVEYSPYIYAMNRFDKEATNDQLTLYTALLEYGAAVQRILSTPDQVAANGGYADEYYKVALKNALATDLANAGAATIKTYSKADIEAGKATADATYNESAFVAYANADGNPVRIGGKTLTTVDVKLGTNSFTALYGKYDIVRVESSDFASGNPTGFIENAYNIKNVCANTKAGFAYNDNEDWKGTSSLAIVDGAMVHTKELIDKETFTGTDQNYADANYQWWRMWFTSSAGDQDIYIAEFDAKFTNVAGNGNYFMEANDHTIRVTITPSAEKDENGYAKYLTLGTATLNTDTFYKIRYEWYADSDTVAIYVDGALVYTKTAAAPITRDVNYSSFSFAYGAGLTGVTTFDNMYYATACVHDGYTVDVTNKNSAAGDGKMYPNCTECKLPDNSMPQTIIGSRGEGVYYNDTFDGTRYDMSAMPTRYSQTTAGQTWSITDDGALKIFSTAWAPMSIQPNVTDGKISANVGEKFVVEFDFMYGGSTKVDGVVANPNKDAYTFHGLALQAKSSDVTQAQCTYWYNTSNNFLTIGKQNSETDIGFANGVWYNFRYEYVINADDTASYAAYINNAETPLYSGIDTTLNTTIYGWSFCGRSNGTTTLSYDNMYIGVVCSEHDFQEIKSDRNHAGNSVFYKMCADCGICSDETFTVTAGNGIYFNDENATGAKVNVGVDTLKVNHGKKGAIVHGVTDDGTYTVESSGWDYITIIPGGNALTLEKGKKYILEFDVLYVGTSLSSGDNNFFIGLGGAENGGNGSFVNSTGTYMNFKGDYAYIDSGTSTKNFVKGAWYNVRMEFTVTDVVVSDKTTYNYLFEVFVDDADSPDISYSYQTDKSKIYGLCIQGRQGTHTIKLDNFYMGVEAVTE